MKVIGVIPARYHSSRLPGKPIVDICGRPMIWWVYQQTKKCESFDEVVIAVDDPRIQAVCDRYEMKSLMTSTEHDTPTSRLYEVSTCLLYTSFSLKFASRAKPNVMIRDFIVSPGQCLIKKNSIPMEWRRCVMKKNGADDYLLWLLMFNNKMSVSVNDAFVYTHKYTGGNISADLEVMFQSSLELLELLKRNPKDVYKRQILTFPGQ